MSFIAYSEKRRYNRYIERRDMMRTFEFAAEENISVQELLYKNGYSKRLIIALKQTEKGLAVNGERVRG